VQCCRADHRVGRPVEPERSRPAGHAQVLLDEPERACLTRPWPGLVTIGGQAESEQQRIGVDRDHVGGRDPLDQSDRERPGTAAKVEHQRVGPPRTLLHGVDQGSEAFLTVGHVLLLLGVPPLDPGRGGLPGQRCDHDVGPSAASLATLTSAVMKLRAGASPVK